MVLGTWPDMNLILLQAKGSEEFCLYTWPYPPSGPGHFEIRVLYGRWGLVNRI